MEDLRRSFFRNSHDPIKFEFENKQLHSALSWSSGDIGADEGFRAGYARHKGGAAYLYLVTCLRRAFGITRLPGFEDRLVIEALKRPEGRDYMAELTDDEIARGAAEILRLWRFTQDRLPAGPFRFRRNVRVGLDDSPGASAYACEIWRRKLQADAANVPSFDVEFDTFSGYTCCGNVNYGQLQVEIEVAAEDILYLGDVVENAETGEWVILNRDPRGIVRILADGVTCSVPIDVSRRSPSQHDYRVPYMPPPPYFNGRIRHGRFTRLGLMIDGWLK